MSRFYHLALAALVALALPVAAQSVTFPNDRETLDPGFSGDLYGAAIAIDGDLAIVGAPRRDAAYVFVLVNDTWVLEQTLTGQDDSFFGNAVALDNDKALVGAPEYQYSGGPGGSASGGAAYVFSRSNVDTGGPRWSQETLLTSPFAGAFGPSGPVDATFGTSVALANSRAFVGATSAPNTVSGTAGGRTGAVYVHTRQGTIGRVAGGGTPWPRTATISLGTDGTNGDRFGTSLAADGSNVVIGAPDRGAGSAYIYRRSGSDWNLAATLVGSTVSPNDRFGQSVALDDNLAVVGAPYDGGGEPSQGSLTVFRDGGRNGWAEEAVVFSAAVVSGGQMGWSVGIDGTRIVGGADDGGDTSQGPTAHVFDRQNDVWVQSASLAVGTVTRQPASANGGISVGGVAVGSGFVLLGSRSRGVAYAFSDVRPVATDDAPDAGFTLGAPHPNPTTGRAALALTVGEPQHIRAELVDALGRRVQTLLDGPASGTLDLDVEVAELAPGVYAVWVRGETASIVRRLTVVR